MEVHGFVHLLASITLDEARAPAFDLYATIGRVLNVFDISAAMTDNLSPQVEPRNRLEINRNLLLWPFALLQISYWKPMQAWLIMTATYASELVSLYLFWLASAKAALVHQIWKFLLHELIDLGNGFLQALLGRTRHVKIEWWILYQ